MSVQKILLLVVSLSLSTTVFGWGQTGHRVTGALAETYLNEAARKAINDIIPNESLAEASTYADEMRSESSEFWKKTASPWHYVTVAKGKSYPQVGAPEEGDAVTAIDKFTRTLKDKNATLADKQLALRFLVHLIGDLHQPLHNGNGTDRGGNDVKLEFFWEDSNLHRVWDSGMIDRHQLSYTEWTQWLQQKMSDKQVKQWSDPDPQTWIAESIVLRPQLYPSDDKLSYGYKHQHLPTLKLRLQQAGVRIAAYLNMVFAK